MKNNIRKKLKNLKKIKEYQGLQISSKEEMLKEIMEYSSKHILDILIIFLID